MDAASILDGFITRIFEKRLRTHVSRSISVQVGDFFRPNNLERITIGNPIQNNYDGNP